MGLSRTCAGCQRDVSAWSAKCPACSRPAAATKAQKVGGAIVAVVVIGVAAATSTSMYKKDPSVAPIPSSATGIDFMGSKPELDALDLLPSHPGELEIKAAWRISTPGLDQVMGNYEWPSVGTVNLTCALPPPYGGQCDDSLPTHLRFGDVSACAASRDEPGRGEGRTGPVIMWPTCTLSVMRAGTDAPRHFKQMKAAAADAVAWTEKITGFRAGTPDMDAVVRNRSAGLLAATRVGNVQKNLNISHQLDVGR